ncbi:helix-turn-helix transcriptional regulator [Aquabacterium sp. OR-4]|uniref:helix-turn-helix transcriptional regulator n=1 Tax=Aquabacterium sp. OR-4 TaxID=2978127 RepID=UPI0021B19858|nr:helix-turn-helix domain-containing protein [Aquabacterium sp. OR-4]MDT7833764.1 helix-turn-helix domain-containing protein [Aquabacterium sp. OR-4]
MSFDALVLPALASPGPDAAATERGPAPDRYCRIDHGFLYASARLPDVSTQRPSAVLLLGVSPRVQFGVAAGDGPLRQTGAALVRPLVQRRLQAAGAALVSLNLHPAHAQFLHGCAIGGDGVLTLPRAAFQAHDGALHALAAGMPDRASGQALADALLATLVPLLPPVPAEPPLRATLLQWLAQQPELALAELAQRLGVSYHRMSHLFSQAIGIGYRQWRAFARAQRAAAQFKAPGTLTGIAHDAGFADSAHLSHTWQRTYGLSPSFVRHDNSVQAIF